MTPTDSDTDFYCHGYREGRNDAYRQVRVVGSLLFGFIVFAGITWEYVLS